MNFGRPSKFGYRPAGFCDAFDIFAGNQAVIHRLKALPDAAGYVLVTSG
jgi:hypothetical protein